MIDFRYHLVSLISVFLALAVGIALGAGPLKESIGDVLTGQVEQLRTDKASLRSELDTAHARTIEDSAVLEALAPQLLGDALPGRRVALVVLDEEVGGDDVTKVADSLVLAGAEITAQVTVSARWTDPEQKVFRQALAGSVGQFLDPSPGTSASVENLLAEALAQGLAKADPSNPDALAENAALLLELLASDDSALVTLAAPVTRAADAVVYLVGPAEGAVAGSGAAKPSPSASESSDPAVDPEVVEARREIVVAGQARSSGVVVATVASTNGDLIHALRSDDALSAVVATATGTDTPAGRVTLVLALNARIGGQVGHYGFGQGATAPTATRLDLAPVDRTPVASPPPDGGSDSQGDETTGDGAQ